MKKATQRFITSFHKNKEVSQSQDHNICFYRFQSLQDCECAYEALKKGNAVFLDVSGMQPQDIIRTKDYMRGVCTSLQVQMKEICEDYITYFPAYYHLQIYES